MFKKICTLCGESKVLELFKKAKERKDRRSSWCKKCHSKDASERIKKDRIKANINNLKYKKSEKGLLSNKRYKSGLVCREARKRYNSGECGRVAQARWRSNRSSRGKGLDNALTYDEWIEILKSQNFKCNICHNEFDDSNIITRKEKDHIIPLSKGGGLNKNNVQALCRRCNSIKFNKIMA